MVHRASVYHARDCLCAKKETEKRSASLDSLCRSQRFELCRFSRSHISVHQTISKNPKHPSTPNFRYPKKSVQGLQAVKMKWSHFTSACGHISAQDSSLNKLEMIFQTCELRHSSFPSVLKAKCFIKCRMKVRFKENQKRRLFGFLVSAFFALRQGTYATISLSPVKSSHDSGSASRRMGFFYFMHLQQQSCFGFFLLLFFSS